jgi:hypothetical protein
MFVCRVALRNIVIWFQKRLCTAYVPKVWGAPGVAIGPMGARFVWGTYLF